VWRDDLEADEAGVEVGQQLQTHRGIRAVHKGHRAAAPDPSGRTWYWRLPNSSAATPPTPASCLFAQDCGPYRVSATTRAGSASAAPVTHSMGRAHLPKLRRTSGDAQPATCLPRAAIKCCNH
jgi:hypothetical protein